MHYNVDGWLDKNKDPINQTVVACLAESKDTVIAMLFAEPKDGRLLMFNLKTNLKFSVQGYTFIFSYFLYFHYYYYYYYYYYY